MTLADHVREQMQVSGRNADTLHAQGHMTHCGPVPKTPCVGVLGNNDPEWLHEDIHNGVDLAWEEHILTCTEEDHDMCGMDFDTGTVLIGFIETDDECKTWFGIGGDACNEHMVVYAPDPKAEYSAIAGEIYTQVVHSKYVQNCVLCSPCYPGQGDLQMDGRGDFIAYTLPPDVWGDCVPEGVREWALCIDCGEPGVHGEMHDHSGEGHSYPFVPPPDKVHQ